MLTLAYFFVHSLFALYALKSLVFRRFRMKKGFQISLKTLIVELAGFEPATLCLQSRCATSCAIAP